jgi:hypothetical protein
LWLLQGIVAPAAWGQEKKGEDDPSVAAVQKAGGKIDRDEKGAGKPVVTVNLGTTAATDADLASLKGFDKLKKLMLNGTKVTDAGLEHLKGLTNLEKLYLVDTKVTDAGLEHLKGLPNLKVLSLVGTQITDAGLDRLKELKNLETLFVYGTKVTDDGVKKLKESRPKVKVDGATPIQPPGSPKEKPKEAEPKKK